MDDPARPLGELAAVEEGEPHRLGQAERDHREVDAAQAQDRGADHRADRGRDQRRERQAEPERQAVAGREDGGRVAADHRKRALRDVDPPDREGDPDAEADDREDRGVGQHVEEVRLVMQRQWHDHERADNQHGEPGEARRRQVEPGERGAGGGGLGAWRHRSRDHERSPERGRGRGRSAPRFAHDALRSQDQEQYQADENQQVGDEPGIRA